MIRLFYRSYRYPIFPDHVQAYVAQGKDYKSSGTYVAGMGAQCHFWQVPDPLVIKVSPHRFYAKFDPLTVHQKCSLIIKTFKIVTILSDEIVFLNDTYAVRFLR